MSLARYVAVWTTRFPRLSPLFRFESAAPIAVGADGRSRLRYLPALDGVRGVAIAMVMAIHFGFKTPQSGRIGVTLFFVLSGYLITSLLRDEHAERGRINFFKFYERRARRLLPALVVVIAVSFVWQLARGDSFNAWTGLIAATFYVSNWAIRAGDNLGFLNHTWSLAVEEQFYLWWPLALALVMRWLPRFIGPFVIISAVLATLVAIKGPVLPIDRAAPLLLGCSLAYLPRIRFAPIFGLLAGLALAVMTFLTITHGPLLAAIAILSFVFLAGILEPTPISTLLSWSPLVALGKISYGLYLWHYPVSRVLATPHVTVTRIIADTVVSLALAIISYKFIEAPFRKRRRRDAVEPASGPQGAAARVPERAGAAPPVPEAPAPRSTKVPVDRVVAPDPKSV